MYNIITQTITESAYVIIDDFKDFVEFIIEEKIIEFMENGERSNSSESETNGWVLVKEESQSDIKNLRNNDHPSHLMKTMRKKMWNVKPKLIYIIKPIRDHLQDLWRITH